MLRALEGLDKAWAEREVRGSALGVGTSKLKATDENQPLAIRVKTFPDRGISKCKCPEAGMDSALWSHTKEGQAVAGWEEGGVRGPGWGRAFGASVWILSQGQWQLWEVRRPVGIRASMGGTGSLEAGAGWLFAWSLHSPKVATTAASIQDWKDACKANRKQSFSRSPSELPCPCP